MPQIKAGSSSSSTSTRLAAMAIGQSQGVSGRYLEPPPLASTSYLEPSQQETMAIDTEDEQEDVTMTPTHVGF